MRRAANCTNHDEVYAFHSGGANVVFADVFCPRPGGPGR